MIDFAAFGALTFDCYGTLIDWERGIVESMRPWASRAGASASDGEILAAFAKHEHDVEVGAPGAPYREILRMVHPRVARELGGESTDEEADAFAQSVGGWPAFGDTPEALRRLKARFKLIIVSNVDAASFAGSQRRLGVDFDAVVTAEEVGAYKPDERMFHSAFEAAAAVGVERERVLHVAQSLFHDHAPAKAMGMTTVWVDRYGGGEGGATPDVGPGAGEVTPDLRVETLAELADLVESSAGG